MPDPKFHISGLEAQLNAAPKASVVPKTLDTLLTTVNHAQRGDDPQAWYKTMQEQMSSRVNAFDGIATSFQKITAHFVDGSQREYTAQVNDARNAKSVEEKIALDHPIMVSNIMLQRALTLVASVDHVLAFNEKNEPARAREYQEQRQQLLESYKKLHADQAELMSLVENNYKAEAKENILENIKSAFSNFNGSVIKTLHHFKLDEGTAPNEKSYEELLLHYSFMGSLLHDAPALVTLVKDTTFNTQHIETALPITKKTEVQKQALSAMKDLDPNSTEKNFHTAQTMAKRKVNAAFADQAQKDTTRFNPKLRNEFPHSIRNGYIVENKIINLSTGETETMYNSRSGTPAYTGKGETNESIQASTQENLKQLDEMAKLVKGAATTLHYTLLNTHSSIENQTVMLEHTQRGTHALGMGYTNIATNFEGRAPIAATTGKLNIVEVDPGIKNELAKVANDLGMESINDAIRPDVSADRRFMRAGQIAYTASVKKNSMDHHSCAHGEDRTGAIQELQDDLFAFSAYRKWFPTIQKLNKPEEVLHHIQEVRAVGAHNAKLKNVVNPGFHAMNTDSIPGGIFSKKINEKLFHKTASDIKKMPLNPGVLEKLWNPQELVEELQRDVTKLLDIFDQKINELTEKGYMNTNRYKLIDHLRGNIAVSILPEEERELFKVNPNELNFRAFSEQLEKALNKAEQTKQPISREEANTFIQKFERMSEATSKAMVNAEVKYGFRQKVSDFIKSVIDTIKQKAHIKSTGGIISGMSQRASFFSGFNNVKFNAAAPKPQAEVNAAHPKNPSVK